MTGVKKWAKVTLLDLEGKFMLYLIWDKWVKF